jgi:hypothetical protein
MSVASSWAAVILTGALSAGLAAGCAGPQTARRSSEQVTGASPTSIASPAPVTTAPSPPPGGGANPPAATPWPSDEVAYEPLPRRLTGVVGRSGQCTILTVQSRRWALTGALTASLINGSWVTVTGNLTAVPAWCPGEQAPALNVTSVES